MRLDKLYKEEYKQYEEFFKEVTPENIKQKAEELNIPIEKIVEILINTLLLSLYKYDFNKNELIADNEKIKELGLDNEAINWGNLRCIDVAKVDCVAYIDEAKSEVLEIWLKDALAKAGLNVEVKTEW